MKKNYKPLIIKSVILLVVILIAIFQLIPFNLKESIIDYYESMQNSDINVEQLGELVIIVSLVSGIGLLSLYSYGFFLILVTSIPSVFILINSIKSIKDKSKNSKIEDIIFITLSSLIIAVSVVKLVLFLFKLGWGVLWIV